MTGERGQAGDTGDTGERGPKGDHGDIGATGQTGERGHTGDTGDTGQRGISGLKINRGVIWAFVGIFAAFLFAAVMLQRQIAANRQSLAANRQNVARILALEKSDAQARKQRIANARAVDRRLCLETEKLKMAARQEAWRDYRKLPDFLKLLGLPRTDAIVKQARRDRDRTLRLFKRNDCSTAKIAGRASPSKPRASPRKPRLRGALGRELGDSVQDLAILFARSGSPARVIPARGPKRLASDAATPGRITQPPAASTSPPPPPASVPPPAAPPPSTSPPSPPPSPPKSPPPPPPSPPPSPPPTPEPPPAPAPPSDPGRGRGGR